MELDLYSNFSFSEAKKSFEIERNSRTALKIHASDLWLKKLVSNDSMKTDTKIIIGAIVASVLIIVGAIVVFGNDKKPQRESQGTAAMSIDKVFEDFGDMKGDEEKTATFTIANTSADSVLRIWNVSTFCDCTSATVTIDGKVTGEFNMPMHMKADLKNWIGEVNPKGTALLKVTYRPKVMPVTGIVTRQTSFSTNDPKNESVEVSIKANVL